MKDDTKLCWICNRRPATTREHRSKRSDLRRTFGEVTPSNRLHLNSPQVRRNKWVQSLDSDLLKSAPNQCEHCNSALTQRHDMAWDQFAAYIDLHPLRPGDLIRLNKIFPFRTRERALDVHLYLAKKLGSDLFDFGHSDLARILGDAIFGQRLCPHLYLRLLPTIAVDGAPAHGQTHFEGVKNTVTGQLMWGTMEHFWPGGSVQMAIILDPSIEIPQGFWHPKLGRTMCMTVGQPDRP